MQVTSIGTRNPARFAGGLHHPSPLLLGDSYRLKDKSKDVLGTDPS